MRLNETELKVPPLLATPDEAIQGNNQGQLAHRVRVNGVPNEATMASFSASTVGVNRAKQGQMGPEVHPPSLLDRAGSGSQHSQPHVYERNERK